ncbi:TetR/AcrR family transcriptional regulator [Microbacterium sp. 18062]|uniref:TetR/AcrR family transcriptional regulator n=1 Tax=Microbacterium sp. 18062 TaxID=2681410 RepID=UPI00135C63FA|nr:TetR/AcrR family transcriptional regulator [Microbacterium sp. 18062]
MPKVVDHEQRRRELAQAAMRVIHRVGIEKTTIREIARESGYSSGVLAHYFANKNEILVTAHRAVFTEARRRIQERSERIRTADDLREALLQSLPIDDQRTMEAFVDVAFWAQAILDAELREVRTASYRASIDNWEKRIGEAREHGVVNARSTDRELAVEAMALIDGVSVEALLHPDEMTRPTQEALVDRFLARLEASPSGSEDPPIPP